MYSYGVVLWELLTGEVPWVALHPMQACPTKLLPATKALPKRCIDGCMQHTLACHHPLPCKSWAQYLTLTMPCRFSISPALALQVVGAVGFQGAQLPAPRAGDACLLALCRQCMAAEPARRPSFQVPHYQATW